MNCRTSRVDHLTTISVDETSIIEIGDSQKLTPFAEVLAVQREKTIFYQNEYHFKDYFMFGALFPCPYLHEPVEMNIIQDSPLIHVEKLKVSFIVASSTIHIGSTNEIHAESRVKNIRHLLREKPE